MKVSPQYVNFLPNKVTKISSGIFFSKLKDLSYPFVRDAQKSVRRSLFYTPKTNWYWWAYLDVDHEPLWFLLLALGVVVRILLVELRVVHIRLFDDLHHSSDARGLLREKNANFLQISWVSEKNHPIPFIRKSATFARFENEFRDLEIQFCPFLERVFINFYCFPQENAVSKRPL